MAKTKRCGRQVRGGATGPLDSKFLLIGKHNKVIDRLQEFAIGPHIPRSSHSHSFKKTADGTVEQHTVLKRNIFIRSYTHPDKSYEIDKGTPMQIYKNSHMKTLIVRIIVDGESYSSNDDSGDELGEEMGGGRRRSKHYRRTRKRKC